MRKEESRPEQTKQFELLMEGHPEVQRRMLRSALVFGGTLLALHIAVAGSVIPNAFVSDALANCGARITLAQFGTDVYQIGGFLAGAAVLVGFYRWFWVAHEPPKDVALFRWSKLPISMLAGALILISLITNIGIALSDVEFLANPPIVHWKDSRCAGVEWKAGGG